MRPATGCAHPLTRRAVRIASCVVLAGVALRPGSHAAAQVVWRSPGARQLPTMSPGAVASAIGDMVEPEQSRHFIIRLSQRVGSEVRAELRAGGVELLSYLGDSTFFAVVDETQLDQPRLARVRSLRSAVTIEPPLPGCAT